MELLKKTAVEQHKALVNKEVSALELTKASIERIEKLEKREIVSKIAIVEKLQEEFTKLLNIVNNKAR